MAKRFTIILVCFFLSMTGLMYMFHQASQPAMYRLNTAQNTVAWSGDPDLALNQASLHKINQEVKELVAKEFPSAQNKFMVVGLGKRRVEIKYLAASEADPAVKARVSTFVEKRIPDIARAQAIGK